MRADCDRGTDQTMTAMAPSDDHNLFKMNKTTGVKAWIYKHHEKGRWSDFKLGWEAKEASLKRMGWNQDRRVVIVRRQLSKSDDLVLE